MAKQEIQQKKSPWGLIVGVLLGLFIIAFIFGSILVVLLGEDVKQGNVAIIPVKGVIMTEGSNQLFSESLASSTQIVADIKDASNNPDIQAIIIEIDSPGGAPVASDEIVEAIKASNKTTVAWIREVGASGGYWVASSTEHIVANKLSITGSIGVLGSYLEFGGLLDHYNVTYEKMNAGKYKDLGTPWREATPEERALMQRKINMMHQIFKDDVKKNRNMTNAEIEAVSSGEYFIGAEAKSLKLIDEFGGKDEAIKYIENKLKITAETVTYEHNPTLLDMISGLTAQKSYYMGKGIADGLNSGKNTGMMVG